MREVPPCRALHDGSGSGDCALQAGDPPLLRPPAPRHGRASASAFAERIEQAIDFHDGEALDARDEYFALSKTDADALLAFLDSSGRAEFDLDGNEFIDDADFREFVACFEEGGTHDADHPCAISDVDRDGDVDEADFELLLVAFEDDFPDCDLDGMNDMEALVSGEATDCNHTGVPDECEDDANGNGIADSCEDFIRGDSNDEGEVGISDPIHALGVLFSELREITRADAADSNDDDGVDIADPIDLLNFLFSKGPPIDPPYPSCGL